MKGNFHVPFWRAVEGATSSLTLIIAASLNILQKGLITVGHTGTYAWGDLPSWAVGAILSSNGESGKKVSPAF